MTFKPGDIIKVKSKFAADGNNPLVQALAKSGESLIVVETFEGHPILGRLNACRGLCSSNQMNLFSTEMETSDGSMPFKFKRAV